MKNKIENNQNNGIQEFKETNIYYTSTDNKTSITDIVDGCKSKFKLSHSIILNISAFVADVISIYSFFNELPRNENILISLFDYLLNGKMNWFLFILIAVLSAFVVLLFSMNVNLILKSKDGRFLRVRNQIYVIKLKRCPKCSNHCSGKLKFELRDKTMWIKCSKEESHKWKLDYSQVFDLIDEIVKNSK